MAQPELPQTSGDNALLSRLDAYFNQSDDTPSEETPAPAARTKPPVADEPETDEVEDAEVVAEAEDAEDDTESEPEPEPEPEDDYFDLTYNGESVRVKQEDARQLAQMGYHYKQNQDQFDQSWQSAQQSIQQIQRAVQQVPELREADMEVAMYDRALRAYDHAEMQRLAADDPAAYVAKRAEYDSLLQMGQQAVAKRNQLAQELGAKVQETHKQIISAERERLLRAVPHWRDQERFKADSQMITSYLRDIGYKAEEIDSLMDSRATRVAYDAARYRKLQASKSESRQKLKNVPKVAKPGAATEQPEPDAKYKALRAKLKKSGRPEDAVSLLLSR